MLVPSLRPLIRGTKLSHLKVGFFCELYVRQVEIKCNQDRQCAYNVTLRRVCAIIIAVKNYVLQIMRVCS
jgi:hypothetical protein